MGNHYRELETPGVIVDRERLEANIRRVGDIARSHGLRLRPHAKTHKCLEIARLQMQDGAVGLTCSKTDEALYFLDGGIPSVTVAYTQVIPAKVERLLRAAWSSGAEVRLTVDSQLGVDVVSGVAESLGLRADVFLKVDVGLERCGVSQTELPTGARAIAAQPFLCFAGILSHAGHAYSKAENADEVEVIAEEERLLMVGARDRLRSDGIEVPEVSVGSTPTVLASKRFEGITEIRPGNYVFMDRTPFHLGLVPRRDIALFVLATVVSRNEEFLIVDAGSKVLSSDMAAHGSDLFEGNGEAFPLDDEAGKPLQVVGLSEEHGKVVRDGRDVPLGSKVRIIPNHSCPVVNLVDELTVCDADGTVVDTWTVGARGKVL